MPKLLGLDYGSKRVGVAVSDETGEHVFPRELIQVTDQKALFQAIQKLVQTESIERIVVGLPLTMQGERGLQATEVQDVMSKLEEVLSIPVEFEDERLSSSLADRFTNDSSFSRDSLAAAAILESYIERNKQV